MKSKIRVRNKLPRNIAQKATSPQVTTMLATSKNVLFPGHNHLRTIGTDDPTLIIAQAPARGDN